MKKRRCCAAFGLACWPGVTLILCFTFNVAADDTASTLPAPPVAKKVPKTTEMNGHTLVDNYYWLRDKKNPDVKAYLDAENAYTDAVMKPTEGLQKKLYDEMLSRVKETDVEVPYKQGAYFYYLRTEAGKQYGIRCRRKGSMDAPEEVLLDVNELAEGQKFMSVGAYSVSDDGNLLAYSTDNTGFRQYTLAVKDLRTGKLLADHAERVDSVVWANDNKTIFYTVEDADDQARIPDVSPHDGDQRAGFIGLRGERREIQCVCRKDAQQGVHLSICGQPYDQRGALHFRRPAASRMEGAGTAQAGCGVLPGSQWGFFLHPSE